MGDILSENMGNLEENLMNLYGNSLGEILRITPEIQIYWPVIISWALQTQRRHE